MKFVYIFFGERGTGKSYNAKRFSKHYQIDFYEGDEAYTPVMQRLRSSLCLLPDIVQATYLENLTQEIIKRMQYTEALAVSQELYSDHERWAIYDRLTDEGYQVIFYWMKPFLIRNIQYLWRQNKWKALWSWLIRRPYFEKPTHYYRKVNHYFDI